MKKISFYFFLILFVLFIFISCEKVSKSVFSIDPSACNSCGKCLLKCPVDAIEFSADNKAMIDQTKCIQCGKCVSACPQNAIY